MPPPAQPDPPEKAPPEEPESAAKDAPHKEQGSLADRVGLVVGSNFVLAIIAQLQGLFLVRLLTKPDYGTWAFLLVLFGTARDLGAFAIPDSIMYFAPKVTPAQFRGLVRQSLGLLFGVGCVAALVLATLALAPDRFLDGHEDAAGLLFLLGGAAILALPSGIFNNVFIATNNHRKSASIATLLQLTSTAGLLIPAWLGMSLTWLIAIFTANMGLRFLLSYWLYDKLLGSVKPEPFPGGLRAQLKFVVPLGTTRLASLFNQKFDKFVVGLFFSAAAFAEFAVGSQELPLVSILPYSIAALILPQLVERFEKGETPALGARSAVELWHASIRKATIVMLPLAAFLLVTAEPLMVILYGESYAGAALPFRIYTSLLPLRVTGYGIMLMAFGQTQKILRIQIYGLFFNVAASFALIPIFGMVGAPLSAVLTQVFMIFSIVRRIDRVAELGIRGIFPWKHYSRTAAASILAVLPVAAALIATHFSKATPHPGIILAIGLPVTVAIYLSAGRRLGVLTQEDRDYVRRWARLEPLRKPKAPPASS